MFAVGALEGVDGGELGLSLVALVIVTLCVFLAQVDVAFRARPSGLVEENK